MENRQKLELRRREFCRAAPAAVMGAMTVLPTLPLFSCGKGVGEAAEVGSLSGKENPMGKTVKEVRGKVLSVKGTCGQGHKAGDVVTFTEGGVDGHICIHALYSMFPKVFAMMFNAEFPWASDPNVLTHACPDAFNPVVFELTRIYGESVSRDPGFR